MNKTPNILFICADQLRADHTGFMGNAVVKTPNLDALAARAMVFDSAWVSNPVCMPNRSSILTGRMPTAHGVVFNDRSLDWNANTFVRQFKQAGYRTALLGKSHLQHGMSRNAVVPFRGEGAVSDPYPEGWDHLEHDERYVEGNVPFPDSFYGFDTVELAIDHGARVSGHHYQWAREKGASHDDLMVDYSSAAPGSDRLDEWWQVYRPPYDESIHSTTFVAERTVDFINAAADEPWLAMASFPDPHHPMTPPGKWFDRHRPEDMALPESRHDTLAMAPAHLRVFRDVHPGEQRNWVAPCGYGSDRILRSAIAATYGMIEMMDDAIGKIISALEARGERDNTIIVFTSDHGDMMGDHSLFLKGFMHYRGTLQVPMLIDVPGASPGRTQSLAASVDLGPTLMDCCGLPGYDGIQGVSLQPVIADDAQAVRDCVLIEDDVADITARLTPIPGKTRTLITAEHRYTRNSKGEEQLFDLRADPDEMNDIRGNTAVRGQLVEGLMDALIAADDAGRGAPATG